MDFSHYSISNPKHTQYVLIRTMMLSSMVPKRSMDSMSLYVLSDRGGRTRDWDEDTEPLVFFFATGGPGKLA